MNHEVIISLNKVNDLARRLISEHDGPLTDEQKQDVRTIISATQSLLALPEIPTGSLPGATFPEQIKRKQDLLNALRTPINSILASCKVLRIGLYAPVTHSQKEIIQTITETIQPLLEWVNNAAGSDPVVPGRTRSDSQYFDFGAKLQEIVLELPVDDRAVNVRTEIWGDIPKAYGDANLTKQLLNILITDVAKMLHEGAISVRVQSGKANEGAALITVTISQTGSQFGGSDSKDRSLQNKIGHAARAVGYSMARSLVERQDGNLWIQNDGDRPETVCFSLPTQPFQSASQSRAA